ncbi:hypothetical protein D3C75_944770 [compost metagenome]
MSPAVIDALEVIHIKQHQPVGILLLRQPGPALLEGPPVHDAGEGIVQQSILSLQQAVSQLTDLPQAAVHEPGTPAQLDLHQRRILDEAAERSLHQRLLLAKNAHQKQQTAQPDTEQCQRGQHHHQQGILQVAAKVGGRQIDVEIPVDIRQRLLQVAAFPDHVQHGPLARRAGHRRQQ